MRSVDKRIAGEIGRGTKGNVKKDGPYLLAAGLGIFARCGIISESSSALAVAPITVNYRCGTETAHPNLTSSIIS